MYYWWVEGVGRKFSNEKGTSTVLRTDVKCTETGKGPCTEYSSLI